MFVATDHGHQAGGWKEFTLIMPAVSVGNVGQLACDLIISTLSPKQVGYLYDDSILPVVGNDPYIKDSRHITTAIDVYESDEHRFVIIQQRAPLVKGKRLQFIDRISNWIKSSSFRQVIILTSVYSYERKDSQLVGAQTRYIATPEADRHLSSLLASTVSSTGLIPLERRNSDVNGDCKSNDDLFIPGSGIAKTFYQKCSSENWKCLVLLIFSGEGDNVNDAIQLSSVVNSVMKWFNQDLQWRIPPSWKHLFGGRFEQSIFQ